MLRMVAWSGDCGAICDAKYTLPYIIERRQIRKCKAAFLGIDEVIAEKNAGRKLGGRRSYPAGNHRYVVVMVSTIARLPIPIFLWATLHGLPWKAADVVLILNHGLQHLPFVTGFWAGIPFLPSNKIFTEAFFITLLPFYCSLWFATPTFAALVMGLEVM